VIVFGGAVYNIGAKGEGGRGQKDELNEWSTSTNYYTVLKEGSQFNETLCVMDHLSPPPPPPGGEGSN